MRIYMQVLRIFFFALLTVVLIMSASCSRSKPQIPYGFIKLVLYQGDTEPREHYSFFIIADDEDGIENLDELYLFHDKEQLRWYIKNDEWISYSQGEQTWIGTRSITIPEGSLPRGVFRAVLINKGGEKGERYFTYDGDARFPFPELDISNGFYTVRSEWPVNRLVGFDRAGNYSVTVELLTLTGPVSQLNLPPSVRTVALWAEDTAYFCSAFTNVVSVN